MSSPKYPINILVACKRVIDYAVRIRVKPDGTGVDHLNMKHSVNPFDEIALEEALRLREKLGDKVVKDIVVVSCGTNESKETIKSALAMGADRAIHVDHSGALYPSLVAQVIAKIVSQEKSNFGLVILGKQAIDDDCNQTGQILAGLLNWSQATSISKVDFENDYLHIVKEVDSGSETIKCKLPSILTADLRLNEPRYATLQNIMKSKQKIITTESIKSLEITLQDDDLYKITKTIDPPKRPPGRILPTIDDLVVEIKKLL